MGISHQQIPRADKASPIMTNNMLGLLKQGKVTRSNALARSRRQLGLMQLCSSRQFSATTTSCASAIPIADIREQTPRPLRRFHRDELRRLVTDLVGQKALCRKKANGGWKVMRLAYQRRYVRAGERTERVRLLRSNYTKT